MVADSAGKTSGRAALAGLRVLDLTRVLAGPYCTMVLADLGAQVVKVERPGTGDDARHFGPFLPSGCSAYFAGINRGKQSIVLDLKADADRGTFLRLVERADVLVENFRPGTMAGLGLAAERLREINPRLVYASLSGFGQTGPEKERAAYDVIAQALSGLMSITGEGPGRYVKVGTSIADILTGLYGVIGIVAALHRREQTGQGGVLDLAMLDCTVSILENAIARYSITGVPPEPLGTGHPSITPFQAFAAGDAPLVVAAGNDILWRKLCDVLGGPQLADDPRLATNRLRTENVEYLNERLAPLFAAAPQAEWLQRLTAAGIPCAPIRNLAEVAADPHLRFRGMLHEMQDAAAAPFLTAGSPLHIDGGPPPLSPTAPQLGEHTAEVLAEWLGSHAP